MIFSGRSLWSKWVLSLSLATSFAAPAFAQGYGSGNGGAVSPAQAERSIHEWKKFEFESQLREKLTQNISVVVPPSKFIVFVDAKLKKNDTKKNSEKKQGTVNGAGLPGADAPAGLGALQSEDLMSKLAVDGVGPNLLEPVPTFFEALDSVQVRVTLNEDVPADREAVVKAVLDNTLSVYGTVKPKFEIKRLGLQVKPEPPKEKTNLDWLMDFKNPVGQIVAFVIFGFIITFGALLVVRTMGSVGNKLAGAAQAFADNQKAQIDAAKPAPPPPPPMHGHLNDSEFHAEKKQKAPVEDERDLDAISSLISSTDGKHLAGLEKFKSLVHANPKLASSLIRQWIRLRPDGATDALVVITRTVRPDDLVPIFNAISAQDRKAWGKLLSAPLSREALGRADLFLNNQIIMNMIVPKPKVQGDVQEMLMSLSPEDVVAVAQKDLEVGACVLNLISPQESVRVAQLCPDDLAETLFLASARITKRDIHDRMDQIREVLSSVKSGGGAFSTAPFVENIPDMISSMSVSKESIMFKMLAQSAQWDSLKKLSARYFPATLVMKLPESVLKEVFLALPAALKADLIVTQSEETGRQFTAMTGEPGKKLRDMLDLEIGDLQKDAARLEKAVAAKEQIWKTFVERTREYLRTDTTAGSEGAKIIATWIEDFKNVSTEGVVAYEGFDNMEEPDDDIIQAGELEYEEGVEYVEEEVVEEEVAEDSGEEVAEEEASEEIAAEDTPSDDDSGMAA